MEIRESRHRNIVVLELRGSVDARSTHEFELKVSELLDKGTRLFAIGFEELEQLPSSGLRVLVMLMKKLAGLDGGLVLYSMSSQVKTIFEVSGLTNLFSVVSTKKEAIRYLSSSKSMSKLSLLATKLLDGGKEEEARAKRGDKEGKRREGSRLSAQVARLLSPKSKSTSEDEARKSKHDGSDPIEPGPTTD